MEDDGEILATTHPAAPLSHRNGKGFLSTTLERLSSQRTNMVQNSQASRKSPTLIIDDTPTIIEGAPVGDLRPVAATTCQFAGIARRIADSRYYVGPCQA